jgi:hypothetical protein
MYVVVHLPSKLEALSSTYSTAKKYMIKIIRHNKETLQKNEQN